MSRLFTRRQTFPIKVRWKIVSHFLLFPNSKQQLEMLSEVGTEHLYYIDDGEVRWKQMTSILRGKQRAGSSNMDSLAVIIFKFVFVAAALILVSAWKTHRGRIIFTNIYKHSDRCWWKASLAFYSRKVVNEALDGFRKAETAAGACRK